MPAANLDLAGLEVQEEAHGGSILIVLVPSVVAHEVRARRYHLDALEKGPDRVCLQRAQSDSSSKSSRQDRTLWT